MVMLARRRCGIKIFSTKVLTWAVEARVILLHVIGLIAIMFQSNKHISCPIRLQAPTEWRCSVKGAGLPVSFRHHFCYKLAVAETQACWCETPAGKGATAAAATGAAARHQSNRSSSRSSSSNRSSSRSTGAQEQQMSSSRSSMSSSSSTSRSGSVCAELQMELLHHSWWCWRC